MYSLLINNNNLSSIGSSLSSTNLKQVSFRGATVTGFVALVSYFLWHGFKQSPTIRTKHGNREQLLLTEMEEEEKVEKEEEEVEESSNSNSNNNESLKVIPFNIPDYPYTVDLSSIRRSDVGSKGHSLIWLSLIVFGPQLRHSPSVPPGFVLTTSFFKPWLTILQKKQIWMDFINTDVNDTYHMENTCTKVKKACADLFFTFKQRENLMVLLNNFDYTSLFAVRSSSPSEDLASFSFAGGYETVLGVPNRLDQIEDAVRKVFISCFDPRVVLYKKQHNFQLHNTSIAVVIQVQIHSAVAGVVFSTNPISNCYDEAVINSNWGVGETVVSGDITPDQYIVSKTKRIILDKQIGKKEKVMLIKPDGGTEDRFDFQIEKSSLTDDQVFHLIEVVNKIEVLYGKPVDIEFAFDNQGKLYILQVRPITAYFKLPKHLITQPNLQKYLFSDITTIIQGILVPISPLGISLIRYLFACSTTELVGSDFLVNSTDISDRYIIGASSGRLYVNLSNIFLFRSPSSISSFIGSVMDTTFPSRLSDANSEYNYKSTNSWLRYRVFLGILSSGILKKLYCYYKFRSSTPESIKHQFLTTISQIKLNAQRLSSSSRTMSLEQFLNELFGKIVSNMFYKIVPVIRFIEGKKTALFEELRRNKVPLTDEVRGLQNDLISSLPGNVTTAMGVAISNVARELIPIINDIPNAESLQERLVSGELPQSFMDAWKYLLENYGHRGELELDISTPRFKDRPNFLLDQIYLQAQGKVPSAQDLLERSQARREAAKQELEKLIIKNGGSIKNFASHYKAILQVGGLRESPKELVIYLVSHLRMELLKRASALVASGRLTTVDDIWNLTLQDLALAESDSFLDLKELCRKRKHSQDSCRPTNNDYPSLVDSRGKIFRYRPPPSQEGELVGFPISSGLVTAPVKVLRSPNEKPLLPGEILVARATNPGWTPLFVNASGVLLEIGGMLQHGALVAREYGKPCVAGITNLTDILKDGMVVELNGTTGKVKIVKDATE